MVTACFFKTLTPTHEFTRRLNPDLHRRHSLENLKSFDSTFTISKASRDGKISWITHYSLENQGSVSDTHSLE